ncbi:MULTISPECIES: 50S ribosomal protein L6 [unclassified Acetomicrobium]|uniref:50S ribosomal protein L6 n=1 Tax=unclassified Acetomicrobium TaxID=2627317 RepID=UPI001BCB15E9|nr:MULTISPECIES: 50S ribosomal protein L6 [Acetomicrobium]
MSRIGRKPISIPKGVNVTLSGRTVRVKGPKGEMSFDLLPNINVELADEQIMVTRNREDKKTKAFHGLVRAMLSNIVTGVTQGFEKELEIVGVGYRAQMQGQKLVLNLGYSNPVEYVPPKGITITTDSPTKIKVSGIDKQEVGQVAAIIRSFRAPEPYKGKGIRYVGEVVKRKTGKASAK